MDTWFEEGHVAIVTGASRGFGKAIARELARCGLHVVIDGRDPAALAEAREDLRRSGNITAIAGDVDDDAHLRALVAAAEKLGRLDLLVNNASTLGATPLPRIDELTRTTLRRLFEVNVFAPIHLAQRALPLLRRGAFGTIANVTSDAGVEAYPRWGGYGATKAALEHVSRVFAAELEGDIPRVLVADPGEMDTQMHRDAVPDAEPGALRAPADAARALLDAIASMRAPFERVRLADRARA